MKYGLLTFIEEAGKNRFKKPLWRLLCECGKETIAIASQVRSGKTKSCGHLKSSGNRKTHGHRIGYDGKQDKTYTAWCNMKRRCTNKENISYHNYGGRGIVYDSSWEIFDKFFEDMGECPIGKSLDRIDNNGNYNKENCRWATWEDQCKNKRQAHLVELNGVVKNLSDWANELDINYITLFYRLKRGMPIEKALKSGRYHRSRNHPE